MLGSGSENFPWMLLVPLIAASGTDPYLDGESGMLGAWIGVGCALWVGWPGAAGLLWLYWVLAWVSVVGCVVVGDIFAPDGVEGGCC